MFPFLYFVDTLSHFLRKAHTKLRQQAHFRRFFMPHTEKRYKKGEIICRPKEMVMSMYNILYGSVGVYFDYGTPEQVAVVTMREGDFFNVISFLESRPRNTTAVALENTIVSEITYDNFSAYFREKPAKIMSLLQHMSARMRQMQKAYVDTCHALEVYGDKAKLAAEHGEWTDSHNRTYNLLKAMFPSVYHEEEK
jgi:CRP-like cAMP-binding protein